MERDAIENAGELGNGFMDDKPCPYAPGPGLNDLTGIGSLACVPITATGDLVLVKECDGEYEPGAGAFMSSLDAYRRAMVYAAERGSGFSGE